MFTKTKTKLSVAMVSVLLAGTGAAHAATIAQTTPDSVSGAANYGQMAVLDSSLNEFDDFPLYELDSFSLWKGYNNYSGNNPGAVYIDVYLQGTFVGDPDFSGGLAPVGLTYLGSSDNAVDYAAGTAGGNNPLVIGDKLTWTFNGIQIPVNTPFYLVVSDDNVNGDLVGASFINNGAGVATALSLTNISATDSNPLFAGNPASGNPTDEEDNYYQFTVSVDEPADELMITSQSLEHPGAAVGEVVRLDAQLSVTPENPDDPSQVAVWAVCTGPDGVLFELPGFFYRDYRLDPDLGVVATGSTSWQVRFAPTQPGVWTLVMHAKQGSTIVQGEALELTATAAPGNWRGYLRIDPERPRYLRYGANGEAFFGIGANIFTQMLVVRDPPSPDQFVDGDLSPAFLADSLRKMEEEIDALAAAGGNLVRLRLDSWWVALEAPDLPLPGLPDGAPGFSIGRYHAANAWIIDRILEKCREHGIVAQLCTWNPNTYLHWGVRGTFDKAGHSATDYHCYAIREANGELAQRRLRYQVARWSADPALGIWEYFNEIGHSWNDTADFDIYDAHWQAITAWLRGIDPYDRPITNSKDGIDTRDLHAYLQDQQSFFTWTKGDEMQRPFTLFRDDETKPFILGEYGEKNGQDPATEIPHIREGLWAAICSGKAGAMNWRISLLLRENHVEPMFAPAARFLAGENLEADWRATDIAVPDGLLVTGMSDATSRSFIYLVRTPCYEGEDRLPLTGASVTVNGLPDGAYVATWNSTRVAEERVSHKVESHSGALTIALPDDVTRDIALKITPADNDSDGDGINDGDEVGWGTDHLDRGDRFRFAEGGGIEIVGNEMTISWESRDGKTYKIEGNVSLGDSSWSELPGSVPGTDGVVSYAVSLEEGSYSFFRVKVLE